jgi:cytochrome c5
LGKGYDGLLTSVLKGKGAMPARGGSNPADISDYELGCAVVYSANSAGGKLPEPKAPEAK